MGVCHAAVVVAWTVGSPGVAASGVGAVVQVDE